MTRRARFDPTLDGLTFDDMSEELRKNVRDAPRRRIRQVLEAAGLNGLLGGIERCAIDLIGVKMALDLLLKLDL